MTDIIILTAYITAGYLLYKKYRWSQHRAITPELLNHRYCPGCGAKKRKEGDYLINFFILGGIAGASLLGLAVMLSIRRDAEDTKPIEIHIVFDDFDNEEK